jgi:hypothetical protein
MFIAVGETKTKLRIQLLSSQFPERVILRYYAYIKINSNVRTQSEVISTYFFLSHLILGSLTPLASSYTIYSLLPFLRSSLIFSFPFYLNPLILSSLISSFSISFIFFVSS